MTANEDQNSKDINPRNIVRAIGKDIRKIAEEQREFISDVSKEMTKAEDIGDVFVVLADISSDYIKWENIIASGIEYKKSLQGLYGPMNSFYAIQSAISTAGSSAIASSSDAVSVNFFPYMDESQKEKAAAIKVRISRFVDREEYQVRVRELLAQFGFEGSETLSKFNGAWELFQQRPEGADLTSGIAIPLRETFRMVISELLRRRPTQEKARGREIISIGDQVGKEGIDKSHFDNLQVLVDETLNQLSGKKQKIENVREIEEFLLKGTTLLVSLLEALDVKKLRK